MNKPQSFIENIVSHVVSSFKQIGSTAALVGVLAGSPAIQSCDTPDTKSVIELNDSQKEFAELLNPVNPKLKEKNLVKASILDNTPVPFITVSPKTGNSVIDAASEGMMDLEMKIVDPKLGSYNATPVIHRQVLENILKAIEKNHPNNPVYGISLVGYTVLDIKSDDFQSYQKESSLFSGVEIVKVDDNNPSTLAPYVSQLSPKITLDEFKKYYTIATDLKKNYELNRDQAIKLYFTVFTNGKEYPVSYIFNPVTDLMKLIK